MRATLVSKNSHKARELAVLLPGWSVDPIAVDELPEETGATFYENARAKAAFGREVVGAEMWTIGEDSGVEVEGLGGRPGIRSARYAGLSATDEENVAKLLDELDGVRRGRAQGAVRLRARLPVPFRRGVSGQRDARGPDRGGAARVGGLRLRPRVHPGR